MGTIDITHNFPHVTVLQPWQEQCSTDLAKYNAANPVVWEYNDRLCGVKGFFTSEKHRKVWATMAGLCYDVRDTGYVLSPENFDIGNMVLYINNTQLKFRKILVIEGKVDQGTYPDFQAVADYVEAQMVANPHPHPIEVGIFLNVLRDTTPTLNPMKRYDIVECNFALMKDDMRKDFIVSVMDISKRTWNVGSSIVSKLDSICLKVDPNIDWQVKAMALPALCPLAKIFHYNNFNYARTRKDWRMFIRNALVHLVIDHGYTPENAFRTLSCLYEHLFCVLHSELISNKSIALDHVYRFQPAKN